MTRLFRTGFWLLLLTAGGRLAAAEWSQLKIGMSPEEAMTILGEPLFRNAGQGFEVWIYDEQAEVVFYGPLVGWTHPHAPGTAAQTVDVWQMNKENPDLKPQVLPRPSKAEPTAGRRVAATKARLPIYR